VASPFSRRREAVALAVRSGRRLVAVSRGESPGALYLFGGAFEAVLGDLDASRVGAAPGRVLYVTTSPRRREEARVLGMRAVAPADLAGALEPWRPEIHALSIGGPSERRAAVAA
jgi:hypothetical protein